MAANVTGNARQNSTFVAEQVILADKLTAAFFSGRCDLGLKHGIHQLFPGCRSLSLTLPAPGPKKQLLCVGNMAADPELTIAALPLSLAAAGFVLLSRQWLHVTRSSMPGLSKYVDLKQAWHAHDAEAVIMAPVLARLPSWTCCDLARLPSWTCCDQAMPAFGVLTLGVDASTLVDARLLTSLFLLAHLVAEQMVQQGANFMLGNCPSVPLCLCQRSGVQSESGQPADVPSSQPAYPDGHRSRSVSSRPAHVMEAGRRWEGTPLHMIAHSERERRSAPLCVPT